MYSYSPKGLFPFLILVLMQLSFSSLAQQIPKKQPEVRPKVGLVLSGGGAKGFAYVGLLRVLDEVNMPIDYIGGSSIGAIVGGLYAVGYHPDTIEQIIRSVDWDMVISNRLERKYMAYEEKLYGEKYALNIPVKDNKLGLSTSLSGSLHVDMMLNRFFSPAYRETDFSKLNIPFLCIGTNVVNGEAVIIEDGSLARAIRGSMAIPGYFPMVEYNGYYLIDGGVVNNYPARQIKDKGMDIIIGGDVQNEKIKDVDELKSIPALLDHIVGYNRIDANVEGFALTDFYIRFDMEYGMMDFTAYDSIIALGERIARENYDGLKFLADSLNAIEYSEPRLKTSSPLTSVFIDSLILDAAPSVGQKVREGYFDNAQSRDVDIKTIENTLQHMAGSKSFSDLYYMLSADEDKTNLIVHMNKAGEGTVSAGFHYDNNYHGSVLANLSIRNLFNTRTKFFTDLILGQNPRLKSLLILNNGLKPGFGVELDFYRFNLSQFEAGVKINSWNLENFGGQVFLPLTFKNSFMFKAGVQYDHFRYKQEVPDVADVPRADEFYGYGGAFAQFNYDSFNKLYFSTSGAKTEFKIKYVFPIEDIINKPANNTLVVYLKYDTNIKLGNRFVFKPGAFGGYTFKGDTPLLQHMFGVGGLNPSNYIENHVRFTGVHFIEDFTYHVGILRANMQYNVFDKFYLTAMNDFGFSERTYADLGWDGMVFGYGGKASYNSFIGPVEFSVMGSTAVKGATYFVNIGFWF